MHEGVRQGSDVLRARLMLVAMCFAWGLTWPAMRVALADFAPFGLRASSTFIGAAALVVAAILQGHDIRIRKAIVWAHVVVVSVFNVVAFSVFATFAQLSALTSRVAILVYTMPIWASLMAWLFLGERLDAIRAAALFMCCVGMAVLIYPLATAGIPGGLLLALGAAVSWAMGTIYMKWAQIEADPLAIATWQLILGSAVLAICVPIFEGSLPLREASAEALFGMVFSGLFGSGLAYLLWYSVIKLLPAMTASLGALSTPVIGVISSTLLLGERPTSSDIVGFVLIFAASVCVLLQPRIVERLPPEA